MLSTDRFAFQGVQCEIGGHTLPVADLSLGGFFLGCDPPLPRGQAVGFELAFPDGARIPAVGRVAWVNGTDGARNEARPTGCGIKITKIAFQDKLALVALLRRAMSVLPPTP